MARTFAATVNNPSDGVLVPFVERAAAVDNAYRQAGARAGAGYVQAYERAITGEQASNPIDLAEVRQGVRNGLPQADLWQRPVIRLRRLLADGMPLSDALVRAGAYAGDLQAANTGMALRNGSAAAMDASPRIVGYRRVTNAGACELCLLASTQRYTTGSLMPMHGDSCHCSTAPIIGKRDPGHVIEPEMLAELKALGIDSKASALAAYAERVKVREHGELGPQLTYASESFTGPSDLPAKARAKLPKR
jgi:hypothetical protein